LEYATSADGVRIAYEATGSGPPLILLHGGGQSHKAWVDAGYVAALSRHYRVITPDARGHGASDKPTARADYAIERVMADVLAVADACGAATFDLIGYSYGGNIGRYLASRTDRLSRFVLIGIGFGPGVPDHLRRGVEGNLAQWAPVLRRNPEPEKLSPNLRAAWAEPATRATLAWFSALLDWPPVEPRDLRCPTLWLVGSRNEVGALESLAQYGGQLAQWGVVARVLDGLDHEQEMTGSAVVLPLLDQMLKPPQ
jgi:pimeloyl-ACP methyl ester carboxylesterase